MAKITKLVANKRAITRTVASSAQANHTALEENLEQVLFGGTAPAPLTIGIVVQAIAAVLQDNYENLEVQDREVATEVAQDRQKRETRDETAARLRQRLIALRTIIEADYGSAATAHLGMSGETPLVPDQLITYAQNVLRRLDDGFGNFKPLLPEITPPDFTPRTDAITQDITSLADAVAAVDQDVRETQDAQNLRNLALTQWTQNYVPVASIIENLYRLAQMPAHAERVRPTSRRRAGTPEPEDIQDEIPTTDSDYAPEPEDATTDA